VLFDLRHNFGQRVSFCRREVGFFVLAEDLKQVDRLFGIVKVPG